MATASAAANPEKTIGSQPATGQDPTRRIFWLFALGHLIVWTLVPLLTQPNAPLDTVEMLFWGHEWQLGYPKHPPLPAWISEAVYVTTGGSVWGIYLVSQVAVVLCFWAAWRLGREMVSPRTALLVPCLLECCYYYNYETTVFNNNVGMYPCWALAVLFLYWALHTGRNRYWIGVGVALGLGLLAKYSMVMLVLTMLLFMLLHPKARSSWLRPGPYLATLAAALVFSPHFCWAVKNGFPTLGYALAQTKSEGALIGRLLNPLEFGGAQLMAVLPIIVVALPLTGYRWRLRRLATSERFKRDFLVAMTVGPFLLHLAVPLVLGVSLRSMYGSQLWTFTGLLILFCLEIKPAPVNWRKAYLGCATLAVVAVAAMVAHNVAGPYIRGKNSRCHFPGKTLATQVDVFWHQRYHQPLSIVAGDWWLAGNVALYGPKRSTVYTGSYFADTLSMSSSYSRWMNDGKLKRCGGVILWNARRHQDGLPPELRRRFPTAEFLEPLRLSYQTKAKIPPAQIGIAIVPPGSDQPQPMLQAQRPDDPSRG